MRPRVTEVQRAALMQRQILRIHETRITSVIHTPIIKMRYRRKISPSPIHSFTSVFISAKPVIPP